MVARPVSRREIESNPEAAEAEDFEWDRLRVKYVWDEETGREWEDEETGREWEENGSSHAQCACEE